MKLCVMLLIYTYEAEKTPFPHPKQGVCERESMMGLMGRCSTSQMMSARKPLECHNNHL